MRACAFDSVEVAGVTVSTGPSAYMGGDRHRGLLSTHPNVFTSRSAAV